MIGNQCFRCGREFDEREAVIKSSLVIYREKAEELYEIENVKEREPHYYCLECLSG